MKEIQESDLARVYSIKNARNIAALGPLVLGVLTVDRRNVLLAGVDFSVSKVLKPWWQVSGNLPKENEILLGAEAARILERIPGQTLPAGERHLVVSGILQATGSQDDHLVFTRIQTAQEILGKQGRISMAEVAALCKDCPITDMVRQISEALPDANVMAIQQVVKGRMEMLSNFRKFSMGISAVVLLIGSLVVLVTMMSSVRERTEEIGVFRAIGFRQSHVIRIIFIEAGILSGLAGIMGYATGLIAAKAAFRLLYDTHLVHMPFRPELATGAFLLALCIGIISSIYPATLAARLDPNDALRAL